MIDKDFIFSKMESLYVSIFAVLILNVIFFIIISIITFYHYIWVCYLSMVIIVIIVMIIINIVVINIIVVIIIVIIIIFLWGRINFYIIPTVWFTPTYQIWSDRKVMFTVSMFVFVCLFICCLFNVLVQQPPFWY